MSTTIPIETTIPIQTRKEREKLSITLKTTRTTQGKQGKQLISISKEIELVNFNRIGVPLSTENYQTINYWFGEEWECTRCQTITTWATSVCKRQCSYHPNPYCCGGYEKRSEVRGCTPCDHSRNSHLIKPSVPVCYWIFLNIFKVTKEKQEEIIKKYCQPGKLIKFNDEYTDLWKSYRKINLFD